MVQDYRKFVGEEHIRTASARDWDIPAAILNAELQGSEVILDIGCATSYFILYAAQFVSKAYGIDDIDNGGFQRFTRPWLLTLSDFEDYRSGKVEIVDQNAARLPFPDDFFDRVFTTSALEHFRDDDDTLCAVEVARVLRPGGYFLGTVDFNPETESPVENNRPVRAAYTYESFMRRVVTPSRLSLKGRDFMKDRPFPCGPDGLTGALAVPLFFWLVKDKYSIF